MLFALVLTGCVSKTATNTYDMFEPEKNVINNEKTVSSNYDETWSKLVRELSKSFYVINNIDKESRLINLSFSMNNNLSEYVDCGITKRTFNLDKFNSNVTYEIANDSEYYAASTVHAAPPNTTYFKIFRETFLEGRANVYVAPAHDGSEETVVSVNTKYIWNVNISFEEYMYMPLYDRHNLVRGKRLDTSLNIQPVNFNTNTSGSAGGVTCVATGKFEEEILNILK